MTNTDTKKYRLLKDLPDAKIGTEFIEDNDDNCYNYTSIHGEGCWYNKHYIENNPQWFEEVLPEPIPNKQDENISFGNDEKIFTYHDIYDTLHNCSKQITDNNKGYLHHLFYNKAIELSKPSTTPTEEAMDIKSYTEGYQMGYTTALKYHTQPQDKGNVLFTKEQYLEIWNMINQKLNQ